MSIGKKELQEILDFDYGSYLLEFNEKINTLTMENERLKKIISSKNEMIHQLEDCILDQSPKTSSIESMDSIETIDDNQGNVKTQDNQTIVINTQNSYIQIQKMLYKNGLFRHPKMVKKILQNNQL